MASNLFDSRKKRVLWLVGFLILNAGYKRFIEHTSGPEFGSPHALSGALPAGLISLIDIFFAISGIVAFIWLVVEIVRSIVSKLKKSKYKAS